MSAHYLAIYRVRDGQIVEAWVEWDNLTALRELGHKLWVEERRLDCRRESSCGLAGINPAKVSLAEPKRVFIVVIAPGRGSQVVRHGSAKAAFVGSIPTLASNTLLYSSTLGLTHQFLKESSPECAWPLAVMRT